MEFYLLPIFAFLCLALVLSHASLPSEDYWRRALPNTPMPKAMEDLLESDRSGWVNTNEFVDRDGDKIRPSLRTFIRYRFDYDRKYGSKTTGKTPTNFDDKFIKSNVANFFLEKDLHRGAKMNLYFYKTHKGAAFLPRQVADSVPFSSKNFSQILNRFSVKPKSVEAEEMKDTIALCEGPGNEGEDKYCTTSLESLIDIGFLEFGNSKKLIPLSTEVVDSSGTHEEYKIGGVVKMGSEQAVPCHKMKYPYAVFYCHATHGTRTYMVNPLVVANNKADQKMESKAVAICHLNTSTWDPNHLAFQVLKVKRGTVPICHFIANGNIVWVSD